ncbi:reverse transcriptase domain-containing protein [Tanacetum coccineum]
MSLTLVDRSFQYPIGITENMLVEVGKFTFLVDFVILEMEKDSKVPLILGRNFLHTADAVIHVKQKQLNIGVGLCIDVIDEILEEDFDALLNEGKPPMDLELKTLPNHLEYAFLDEPSLLPVIISSQLSEQNKENLISVLKRHKRMHFGLCNATATFQMYMLAIFHDMIEESVEVFMDDFSVFGNSFDNCLHNLDKMLKHCKDAILVLNWENVTSWLKKELFLDTKYLEQD